MGKRTLVFGIRVLVFIGLLSFTACSIDEIESNNITKLNILELCDCKSNAQVEHPAPSIYSIPFTTDRQSNFGIGDVPEYAYFDEESLFNGKQKTNAIFDDEQILITVEWWENHTGVSNWIRDVEVIDNVLIINTLRLDWGAGGDAMTFWKLSAFVDRVFAKDVIEYKIVTRNVYSPPTQLRVTIHEKYMDKLVDMDFVSEDFGPLVQEIGFERWDWGIERRIKLHFFWRSWEQYDNTVELLKALPFVNEVSLGFGLGMGVGVELVVSIAPAYNDKFDREQFKLSDFNGIPDIRGILSYQHPNVRVNAQVHLALKIPGTKNLNQLIYCVTNHNPYVETIDWIDRYRIIYHHKVD